MEAKDFVLLMLIPVILIGIVAYTDANKITGAVVAESKDSNLIGTYSVNPSFRAKVDYDVDDYSRIKYSLGLISGCTQANGLQSCINDMNNNGNFMWELGCDKGAEKVLYDFAEFFQDCIDSSDNSCLCVKELSLSAEKVKEYGLVNTFDLILDDSLQGKIRIMPKENTDISHEIDTKGLTGFIPRRYVLGYDSSGRPSLNLFFYDLSKNEDFRGPGPLAKLTLFKNNVRNTNAIDFVKHENDNLKDPRNNLILDANKKPVEVSNLPSCNIKPKNMYRFCVTKKDFNITAYDRIDGQVKQRPVAIKFAAYIPPKKP